MQCTIPRLPESIVDLACLQDLYTRGHGSRVSLLGAAILRTMGTPRAEAACITQVARVHDIGKVIVPSHVLMKPAMLTAEEWALVELHAEHGAEILLHYPEFAPAAEIVRHHHERWDGRGYPHRLKGAAIPFGARVIAVADSFDAMTTDRPYRRAMTLSVATQVLREGRGRQWDPLVVDAFLELSA